MLRKTGQDENVPLTSVNINLAMTTDEKGNSEHQRSFNEDKKRESKLRFKLDDETPSPQFNSILSNSRSVRSQDMVNVNDLQVNPKTFMSFADPEQLMWGGSYYDLQEMRSDQNVLQYQKSLQFRSENPVDSQQFDNEEGTGEDGAKFGTWDGVFASCLLNIFGVIMFLRLPWVVGQAGVMCTLLIIGLAGIVVLLTSMSMAAIVTNGKVEEGGAYFMISRTLGPAIGGASGVLFAIGLAVAVSMYVIGFCETMVGMGLTITGNELNDIRISGLVILTVCLICVLIGIGWVVKLQLFLLFLLTCAILSFFIGVCIKPNDIDLPFADGWSDGTLNENMVPEYRKFQKKEYDFFSVFGIFFPAVTGIMAGANISGDLKDPSTNIPRGTLWAVAVSMFTYAIMAIFLGAAGARGKIDGSTGLHNDLLIMEKMSIWGPLILSGIYAATFTSALASLVGAPRILLSVAKDNLFAVLEPFAVTDRKGNPIRGYLITYIISGACVAIGSLNFVAPLITMFFMITYALINYATFLMAIGNSPGWRPSFKYFHWGSALGGALLCTGIMFSTDYVYAFSAIVIAFGLHKYIELKDHQPSWGSAQEARTFRDAIEKTMKLRNVKRHVKNYRPSYLVMCGVPKERPHLVYLGTVLRQSADTMVIYAKVNVILAKDGSTQLRTMLSSNSFGSAGGYQRNPHDKGYLPEHWRAGPISSSTDEIDDSRNSLDKDVIGFFDKVSAFSVRDGLNMLLQLSGIGVLRPNVIVIGFKDDWMEVRKQSCLSSASSPEKGECEALEQYVGMIQDTINARMGIIIARDLENITWEASDKELFNFDQGIGTIDLWWLNDDGGLTALVAELLSSHRIFRTSKRKRLMVVVETELQWTEPLLVMSQMIKRFRLNLEIVPVQTNGMGPTRKNIALFEEIAGKPVTSFAKPKVTARLIRVGELMRQSSKSAELCILTLPPPSSSQRAVEYLTTLEWLSMMLPPTLLMRGANQNVLTYYL